MKKILFSIFALLLVSACTPTETPTDSNPSANPSQSTPSTNVPQTVDSFESCVAAGNPVMESMPRQCRDGVNTFVESIDLPNQASNQKPCTKEFMPVCGEIQVQCIKAPCEPIKTTFGNKCEAENAGAKNLTEGACVDENVNPEGACLSFDGKWLAESRECEGMGKEQCETLGGTFNDCASACRNDPKADMCTMQCVLVCQF